MKVKPVFYDVVASSGSTPFVSSRSNIDLGEKRVKRLALLIVYASGRLQTWAKYYSNVFKYKTKYIG